MTLFKLILGVDASGSDLIVGPFAASARGKELSIRRDTLGVDASGSDLIVSPFAASARGKELSIRRDA